MECMIGSSIGPNVRNVSFRGIWNYKNMTHIKLDP
jgi:hypothetical protein